jgi:hypothetical protein
MLPRSNARPRSSPLPLAAFAAALALAACDQVESRAQELGTKAEGAVDRADAAIAEAGARIDAEVDRLQELFRGRREDAVTELQARMERWRGEIDELVADVRERGERDGERLLQELSRKRADAAVKLEELRACGGEAWRDLCADLESETADLEKRLREVSDRWRSDDQR